MSIAPRFCGSCGAGLVPGGAFCGACGSPVAVLPQPVAVASPLPHPAPPPPVAVAAPIAAAVPPPDVHVAQPAAMTPPQPGYADWTSVEVQPGETSLGSWLVALQAHGPDVSGSLTVTDLRLLFKPKIAGTSLMGMLLSQRRSFKDRHTVILGRDRIVGVHSERRVLNTYIFVATADGAVCAFNRGLMSPDPILAALQPR